MTLKKTLFFIFGAIICGFGIALLIYGYGIYKRESLNFKFLTFLIFIQIAPEFNIDFISFPDYYIYYYIFELYTVIYTMILEFIQNILQPYIITVFYPFTGLFFITIGSIFIILGIIYYRQEYTNIQ